MDGTDVAQQPQLNPALNQPASGTYGEGAALQDLKRQLPTTPTGSQGPGQPGPPPMPGTPPPSGTPDPGGRPSTGGGTPPPGMPSVLLHPTQNPGTPVTTPLQPDPPSPGAVPPTQQSLILLQMLADPSSGASQQTQEWAGTVLRKILASSQ